MEQVKVLASLNHMIARYARHSAYIEYYSLCGLSSLTPEDLFTIPQLTVEMFDILLWSPHARAAYRNVPSLNRWYLSALSQGEKSFQPYLHLVGVNDTATALASLVLISQRHPTMGQGVDSLRHIISSWTDRINLIGYEKCQLEEGNATELLNEASKNPILSAYTNAFLKAEAGRFGAVSEEVISYQRAVIFLSELDMELTKKLPQMPSAYASIIRTTLVKCLAHPPPNCSPKSYRLIGKPALLQRKLKTRHEGARISLFFLYFLGRHDMALQFEFMQNSNASYKSKCSNTSHMLCPITLNRRQMHEEGSNWGDQHSNPAERWASLVRPLLSTPSMSGGDGGSGSGSSGGGCGSMMTCRHFLLTTLENSPACQVAFEVRAAYSIKLTFTCPLLSTFL